MEVNVTITHALSPALQSLFAALVANAMNPLQTIAVPATSDTPPPRKRKAAAEEAPAAAAPAPTAAPAAPAPPAPMQLVPPKGPTVHELAAMTKVAMGHIGVPAIKGIFKKFGIVGLTELPESKFGDYVQALKEAESLVTT